MSTARIPTADHTSQHTALVNAIVRTLGRKWVLWENRTGTVATRDGRYIAYGLKGSADILGFLPGGFFLAIECKTGNGQLDPRQLAFRRTVERHGGCYVIARSVEQAEAEVTFYLKLKGVSE